MATIFMHHGAGKGGGVRRRRTFTFEYRNTSQDVAANGRRVQDVPRWPRSSYSTAQAKAVAYGEDVLSRAEYRNTSQDVAANGISVQNVLP